MKRLILFIMPMIAWTAWLGWMQYAQSTTDKQVFTANGLTLGQGKPQFLVSTSNRIENEIETVAVNIITDIGDQAYAMDCEIDWDMGGRGFVRAMNVDDDADLEILCYSLASADNRYLDISNGNVTELAFEQAPAESQQLARQWLDAHYPNTLTLGVLLMLTALYYFLLLAGWLLIFMLRRFRQRRHETA